MRSPAFILFILATVAEAADGPAGSSGPCMHVLGPVDGSGQPIGFTCEDVGGSALLIWNASSLNSNITITGGFRTVNFRAGRLDVSGTFQSDGPLAFVGGAISVTGRITGSSVLLAGVASTPAELKTTFLGPSGRLTGSTTSTVTIGASGKVEATSGNLMVAGGQIVNDGQLKAKNGAAIFTTGSSLDVGWDDILWLAGTTSLSTNRVIRNRGSITAENIKIEAHRTTSNVTSIINEGKLSAKDTITFVTGLTGTTLPKSFGVNNIGTLYAAKVTISPYSRDSGGALLDRTFDSKLQADRLQLESDIGGEYFESQDNTTGSSTSVVNTSTASGTAQPTTANLVIPQLAVSVTHMNSTSTARSPVAVASNSSEVVRGVAPSAATVANKKPRVKAKPVLVRGSFFNSKISAKITASR